VLHSREALQTSVTFELIDVCFQLTIINVKNTSVIAQ
jgi:hypothetical protein